MNRKLAVGVVGAVLALGAGGVAVAASSKPAPARVTIDESQSFKMVPNRYIKDGLRWKHDVYHVKSGGTLHIVDNIITEGPHTFSVVKRADLPKNAKQFNNCKICAKLEKAHGVPSDQNGPPGPPKFVFLENGVGSNAPPNVDRPGDSALVGPGAKPNESINLKVTAKKGTTLYFMCLIHPQMQAKVIVG